MLVFRYEEFLTSEKILLQEMQQLEIKFENWSQRSKQDGAPARPLTVKSLASARDVTKDLPHEVAAFDVSAFCIHYLFFKAFLQFEVIYHFITFSIMEPGWGKWKGALGVIEFCFLF